MKRKSRKSGRRGKRAALLMGMASAGLAGSGAVAATIPAKPLARTSNAPDNLFGTATLDAPLGKYQVDWHRARQSAVADPRLQNLIEPARALDRAGQVAFVQTAVHNRIGWMSDATEWGHHDYWASASETLSHGVGDMEDRAIVKMQALMALGFDPDDLFLTLGQDTVGGPLTMLVVRLGHDEYLTLDDLGGAPIAAARRSNFMPTMSFNNAGAWLHGYRRDSAAARSD